MCVCCVLLLLFHYYFRKSLSLRACVCVCAFGFDRSIVKIAIRKDTPKKGIKQSIDELFCKNMCVVWIALSRVHESHNSILHPFLLLFWVWFDVFVFVSLHQCHYGTFSYRECWIHLRASVCVCVSATCWIVNVLSWFTVIARKMFTVRNSVYVGLGFAPLTHSLAHPHGALVDQLMWQFCMEILYIGSKWYL